MKEKLRKIVKIGSSRGVVLPPEFLFAAGLNHGDRVLIAYDTKSVKIFPRKTEEGPANV